MGGVTGRRCLSDPQIRLRITEKVVAQGLFRCYPYTAQASLIAATGEERDARTSMAFFSGDSRGNLTFFFPRVYLTSSEAWDAGYLYIFKKLYPFRRGER